MQYRCKLLNERTIDSFKSYIKPERIYKQNDPYYFMDLNFEKHTKCTDRCYVLLCYNDEPEIKDCHFTFALYGKHEYVNFEMILSMIEGQVEPILLNAEISDYINIVINKTFFEEPEDLNQLKGMYSKLSKRVLEIFDKLTKKNIVFKILNDETIISIINEQEMNVFKFYLSRLPMINSRDKISVMKYV